MNSTTVFRYLVVGSPVIHGLWLSLPWTQWRSASGKVYEALRLNGTEAILPLPPGIAWLCILLYLPTAIGLYHFSKQARWLFVLLTLFLYSSVFFAGLKIETALGAFLGGVLTLADGALIALSFTEPLKQKFEIPE